MRPSNLQLKCYFVTDLNISTNQTFARSTAPSAFGQSGSRPWSPVEGRKFKKQYDMIWPAYGWIDSRAEPVRRTRNAILHQG